MASLVAQTSLTALCVRVAALSTVILVAIDGVIVMDTDAPDMLAGGIALYWSVQLFVALSPCRLDVV